MPPVLIAAGVAAAATIGGAALSSSASKHATNNAAQAEQQVAASNNALAADIYNRNTANFQPYFATGNQAMGVLNGLLFGPQTSGPGPATMPVNALAGRAGGGASGARYFGDGYNALSPGSDYTGQPQLAPQGAVTAPNAPNANDAWAQFRNSSGYQFRLGEGMNALNQGLAQQGALRSGAAQRAAIRYGQNFASGELGNYVNMLQGQQNLGFGAAQALAGVGNNYQGAVTANNNNAADATANAALLRGQATGQLYGGVANALGNFASSFGGSKAPNYAPTWSGSGNAPYYVGY